MDRHLSPAETAKRFGISIKALRLYEQRGLLTPIRTNSGSTGLAWRAYGPDQIVRLHRILALKSLGLPLARIADILASMDGLDPILAVQERKLVDDSKRLARALTLVRAARAKLAAGQALSIDDLATLTKETTMTSKLTRKTLFHPALVPHQHKHFTQAELDQLASHDDFDQEKSIQEWAALFSELKNLTAQGDPGSPKALDLGRRWKAQGERVTHGDANLAAKFRAMAADAMADPGTASVLATSKELSMTPESLDFLKKIMEKLRETGG